MHNDIAVWKPGEEREDPYLRNRAFDWIEHLQNERLRGQRDDPRRKGDRETGEHLRPVLQSQVLSSVREGVRDHQRHQETAAGAGLQGKAASDRRCPSIHPAD
jgi:hypothetical protein